MSLTCARVALQDFCNRKITKLNNVIVSLLVYFREPFIPEME